LTAVPDTGRRPEPRRRRLIVAAWVLAAVALWVAGNAAFASQNGVAVFAALIAAGLGVLAWSIPRRAS
jgi:membrane associated rhomboid family serine protease